MNSEQNPDQPAFPGSSIHPVEELQKKGIKKLRVIPESQLKKAAREAVAVAILELIDDLDIADQVRQELRIRANKVLGHGETSAANVDQSNQDSSDPRQVTTSPLVIPSFQKVAPEIPAGQGQPVANSPGNPLGEREKALLLQLSKLIAQDWRSELASVRDSHRDQVERLECRIQELTHALQTTDQILGNNTDQKATDPQMNESFDNTKSELLDQLFQANVALRALSRGPSKGVSPSGEGR